MRVPILFCFLALAACAGNRSSVQPVTPEELRTLAADRERLAGDPDALTRIGIRYYQGRDLPRAEDALTAAVALRPTFSSAVYLGLTQEARGNLAAAEASYRMASGLEVTRAQREELDRRLAVLARSRLLLETREAIRREAALTSTAPEAGTVAVMPWAFVGNDPALRPLGFGVAHLVLQDLAKLSALKLVERERVQVLLDELALAEGGRVDPRTAARAGRLLRAERVVHGVVRQTRDGVHIEATVVRTADGSIEASGEAGDRLERLFTLEKTILLGLVDQMQIAVSPAERRALTERPVQDLQGFLALSRGLEAEARPTPANAAALTRVAAPAAIGELAARTASLMSAISVIAPSTGGTVDFRTRLPVTNSRLPEALGQDNPSRIAIIGEIIIVIPRP